LIDLKKKNVLAFAPFLFQWLFLPQLYKIETLITQSAIYTLKSSKISSNNTWPSSSPIQKTFKP